VAISYLEVQEFILGLKEKKGVWSTHEIQYEAQNVGHKEATIKRALTNLIQSGKIIKLRRGQYEISNNQELFNS